MHLSAFHLFSDITPGLSQLIREIEKPILRDIFTVSKTEIVLILTENFVVLYNHQQFKTPTHFCPLTFDLKFETLYESIPVTLLSHRIRPASESQLLSSFNAKDALSNLCSTLATPQSLRSGPLSCKRKSTRGTSISFLKPKEKSARAPSPLFIWHRGCETIRWWQ